MKQIKYKSSRGETYYDSPEKGDAQEFDYRGFTIRWERPPIPPTANCDWSACRDGYEEDGSFNSSRIQDLKDEIDEFWEER